jgi:hypothetical protein
MDVPYRSVRRGVARREISRDMGGRIRGGRRLAALEVLERFRRDAVDSRTRTAVR